MQRHAVHTSTGREVWYLHPERTEVVEQDLRAHLSRQCRYAGALDWTVLQHLTLCVLLADGDLVAAYAAAHDLHEAYLPDVPAPLAALLAFPTEPGSVVDLEVRWEAHGPVLGWAAVEHRWMEHVHRAVGLPFRPSEEVMALVLQVDRRARVLEATVLEASEALRLRFERDHGGPATPAELRVTRHVAAMREPALWAVVWGAVERGRSAA